MRIMVVENKDWSNTRKRQEQDRQETVSEYYDKIPRYIITTTHINTPINTKTTILALQLSSS